MRQQLRRQSRGEAPAWVMKGEEREVSGVRGELGPFVRIRSERPPAIGCAQYSILISYSRVISYRGLLKTV